MVHPGLHGAWDSLYWWHYPKDPVRLAPPGLGHEAYSRARSNEIAQLGRLKWELVTVQGLHWFFKRPLD